MGYFSIKKTNIRDINRVKKELKLLLGDVQFYETGTNIKVVGNFNLDDNWNMIYKIIRGEKI